MQEHLPEDNPIRPKILEDRVEKPSIINQNPIAAGIGLGILGLFSIVAITIASYSEQGQDLIDNFGLEIFLSILALSGKFGWKRFKKRRKLWNKKLKRRKKRAKKLHSSGNP